MRARRSFAGRLGAVAPALAALAFSGCSSSLARLDRALFGDGKGEATARAAAVVARLTLDEKIAQLQNAAPAIPQLGIPAYDWWNESLHGVARNGRATVFPQAIALGASFDEDLVRRVGEAIAVEARAKFAAALARQGGSGTRRYQGLTFFAPNVNIFRDPRWGRGQETYGEDPFLTARLGVAYVRGLQGDDPAHLRVAAVGKHFAVHSGPEVSRHGFDAAVDARDLWDTYLPQFEALVREGHVSGIMAAYNRVNGEACVASPMLLGEVLRQRWGFTGFVVGDCGAVGDLVTGHHVAPDQASAAAAALRAGTDLDCGRSYAALGEAVRRGLVGEADVDRALVRLLAVRFRLGIFDADSDAGTRGGDPGAPVASREPAPPPAHRALAREAAQKSLVLLENDGILPIAPSVRRIAVVGPTADDVNVLVGNYHGEPVAPVTLLAGIRAAADRRGITVEYGAGVSLTGQSAAEIPDAVALARRADLVLVAAGLSPRVEGEEGDPDGGNPAGDRRNLDLPGVQAALLAAVLGAGKPTVVVLTGGSSVALPATHRRPNAVLMAWYPGEAGGEAVADVLFGDVSPSGRLPITFYRSVADLPPFTDYRMAGRTYRYFQGRPAYPFGHGLGYAAVVVTGAEASVDGTAVAVRAAVANRGAHAADRVVLAYARAPSRAARDPLRSLVAFRRLSLAAGETKTLEMKIPLAAFSSADDRGNRRRVPGPWELAVGEAVATVVVPP